MTELQYQIDVIEAETGRPVGDSFMVCDISSMSGLRKAVADTMRTSRRSPAVKVQATPFSSARVAHNPLAVIKTFSLATRSGVKLEISGKGPVTFKVPYMYVVQEKSLSITRTYGYRTLWNRDVDLKKKGFWTLILKELEKRTPLGEPKWLKGMVWATPIFIFEDVNNEVIVGSFRSLVKGEHDAKET